MTLQLTVNTNDGTLFSMQHRIIIVEHFYVSGEFSMFLWQDRKHRPELLAVDRNLTIEYHIVIYTNNNNMVVVLDIEVFCTQYIHILCILYELAS